MKRTTFHRAALAAILLAGLTSSATLLHAQTTPTVRPTVPPSQSVGVPAAAPASTAGDIRDIRGPKAVPSATLWMMELAGAAAAAGLAYAGYRWYRHVKLAPKTAGDIALEQLEKALRLMQPESAREFSIEVSEIVRRYIEARFQVRATQQTTEEFLRDLADSHETLLANHQELFEEFLGHCDLAKFARWILSVDEMKSMHGSARNFVIETAKAPAPEKTKTAASATTQPMQTLTA
jgi:hypothetical protein